MRLQNALLLLTVVAVASCGTARYLQPGYSDDVKLRLAKEIDSYVGKTERQLIGTFGKPDKVYDYADGGRDLTWTNRRSGGFYCELKVTLDPRGKATNSGYERSGDIGGLRMCADWLL